MATDVDVCNEALLLIGSRIKITALTDDSEEAQACKVVYASVRDWLLSVNTWNFARRAATLVAAITATGTGTWSATTSPPPQWKYGYTPPTDMLRAVYITDGSAAAIVGGIWQGLPQRFMVANYLVGTTPTQLILSNQASAVLIYVAQITDPTIWSPSFYKAVSAHIAWLISPPLLKDWNVTKYLNELANRNLEIAFDTNDIEGLVLLDKAPEWLQARGMAYTQRRPQVDSKLDNMQQAKREKPDGRR